MTERDERREEEIRAHRYRDGASEKADDVYVDQNTGFQQGRTIAHGSHTTDSDSQDVSNDDEIFDKGDRKK